MKSEVDNYQQVSMRQEANVVGIDSTEQRKVL